MPGGALMIVEYEDENIENDERYIWKGKDATYDANFYMSESLKKDYGLHNHEEFKGKKIKETQKLQKQ